MESESEEEREYSPSTLDSDEEDGEEEIRAFRYKLTLTLEEVDDLLKVVYTTLDIQKEKTQLSFHDKRCTRG